MNSTPHHSFHSLAKHHTSCSSSLSIHQAMIFFPPNHWAIIDNNNNNNNKTTHEVALFFVWMLNVCLHIHHHHHHHFFVSFIESWFQEQCELFDHWHWVLTFLLVQQLQSTLWSSISLQIHELCCVFNTCDFPVPATPPRNINNCSGRNVNCCCFWNDLRWSFMSWMDLLISEILEQWCTLMKFDWPMNESTMWQSMWIMQQLVFFIQWFLNESSH